MNPEVRDRVLFYLAGILVALLILCPAAQAGGYSYYGRSCYSAPSYYQPSYYSYPTYYPVYYKEIQEVQVPYAKPVFINRDYYFTLADYYQKANSDQTIAEAAAYKALLLQSQMSLAAAGQALPSAASMATGPSYSGYGGFNVRAGANVAQPQQPAPQAPPGPVAGIREETPANMDVPPVLKTYVDGACLTCHDGSKPKRMNLTNLGRLTEAQRSLVFMKVHSNRMPKNGKPASNEIVSALEAFVERANGSGE